MFYDNNPMYISEDITNMQCHQKNPKTDPMGLSANWDGSYLNNYSVPSNFHFQNLSSKRINNCTLVSVNKNLITIYLLK